jgi:hypothetical protein
MWIGLAVAGRLKRASLRGRLWFAALGAAPLFANFLFFYNAERDIASGVASVAFAMASAFNAFSQWLSNGVRPIARTVLGALIGVAGVAFSFADQLAAVVAARGLSFAPSSEPVYVGALLYLAAIGSTVGFLVDLAPVVRRRSGARRLYDGSVAGDRAGGVAAARRLSVASLSADRRAADPHRRRRHLSLQIRSRYCLRPA